MTVQEAAERAKARSRRITQSQNADLAMPAPQPGPQTSFDQSEADITGYGGSAGGGKTFSLLREPTKFVQNPKFGAVIFRRTMKQVKDEGGIWDQSAEWYPPCGAKPNMTERFWTFPSGATIQFAGLEHEQSKYDWQGAEICLLEFDELTHFSESQFFYLISRNRSTCGIKPRVRASCNPEPGWVKRLFAPWVDDTFPNPARSGEIRYFVRGEANQIVWLDEKPDRPTCDCLLKGCENCFPPEKSITFIKASVYDNRALLEKDPGYIANLLAQSDVERKRLHDGDWNARPANLVLDAFDATKNTTSWFEIPSHWRRYLGADFGLHNTAEVFLAEDPDSGKLYWYAEDWPGHSREWSALGADIRKGVGRTPDKGAGGNRTGEQGWRQALRKEGIPMEEPNPAHTDPVLQYQCVNDQFRAEGLVVFDTCVKGIAMLGNFQRTIDKKTGEVSDDFDDAPFHLLAALRYIVTLLRPPKGLQPLSTDNDLHASFWDRS